MENTCSLAALGPGNHCDPWMPICEESIQGCFLSREKQVGAFPSRNGSDQGRKFTADSFFSKILSLQGSAEEQKAGPWRRSEYLTRCFYLMHIKHFFPPIHTLLFLTVPSRVSPTPFYPRRLWGSCNSKDRDVMAVNPAHNFALINLMTLLIAFTVFTIALLPTQPVTASLCHSLDKYTRPSPLKQRHS